MWVPSLGLEEKVATHCSILAWRIPMDGGLAGYSPWSHKGDQHDLVTQQQLPHSRTLFSSDFADIALRFLFTLSLVILFLFSSPAPFLLLVPTVDSSHWFCLLSIAILSMYILLGRISLKLH